MSDHPSIFDRILNNLEDDDIVSCLGVSKAKFVILQNHILSGKQQMLAQGVRGSNLASFFSKICEIGNITDDTERLLLWTILVSQGTAIPPEGFHHQRPNVQHVNHQPGISPDEEDIGTPI